MLTINYSFFIEMALFIGMVFFLQRFLLRPLFDLWDERDNLIEGNKRRAEDLSIRVDQLIVYYEAQVWATRKLAQEEAERTRRETVHDQEELLLKIRNESTEALAELREKIAGEFKAAESRILDSAQSMGQMIAERVLGARASE